jgi:hypothetical protein
VHQEGVTHNRQRIDSTTLTGENAVLGGHEDTVPVRARGTAVVLAEWVFTSYGSAVR